MHVIVAGEWSGFDLHGTVNRKVEFPVMVIEELEVETQHLVMDKPKKQYKSYDLFGSFFQFVGPKVASYIIEFIGNITMVSLFAQSKIFSNESYLHLR